MAGYEIWHNPRCSKSRETLALVREQGVEPTIVEYLKAPPSRARIAEIARRLGGAKALVRSSEDAFIALGLSSESCDDALLDAMAKEPTLIQRPVLITEDGRAVIGRPPEAVLALLRDDADQ